MHLFQVLTAKVAEWRNRQFTLEQYPAIGEIFRWSESPDVSYIRLRTVDPGAGDDWYSRLVEETPYVLELYRKMFTKRMELVAAPGVPTEAF